MEGGEGWREEEVSGGRGGVEGPSCSNQVMSSCRPYKRTCCYMAACYM